MCIYKRKKQEIEYKKAANRLIRFIKFYLVIYSKIDINPLKERGLGMNLYENSLFLLLTSPNKIVAN